MYGLLNIATRCRLFTTIFVSFVFQITFSQRASISENQILHGVITRGDTTERKIALVFTDDEFGDGSKAITLALKQEKIKASFFLTENFYRTKSFQKIIQKIKAQGHYLGTKHDSLVISKDQFINDLNSSYAAMKPFGLSKNTSPYVLLSYKPDSEFIAESVKSMDVQLISYTPGTISNADCTTPGMLDYCSSDAIYQSIINKAIDLPQGLNGFILLLHIGTPPGRTDKFYNLLPLLLQELTGMGYKFVRIDQLIKD